MGSYPALDLRYAIGPDTPGLHDLLYAELDPFEPLAIHDRDADGWRVFFKRTSQRDAALAAVDAALGERLLSTAAVEVDDEDWARRSQAALAAIRAGRIVVAPPWDVPAAAGDIVIVIEPSTGFGTGHHATTRMCLELLQTIDLRGSRVIDVGTGSGVLAIAARRLGAAAITAIDNDPDALQNARANLDRDTHLYAMSLQPGQIADHPPVSVVEADLSALTGLTGDVILANLTGGVLQRYAASLRQLLAPGGRIVVSGFSPAERDAVVSALGLCVVEVRTDGEWAAAVLGDLPVEGGR